MGDTLHLLKDDSMSLFISCEEANTALRQHAGVTLDAEQWAFLLANHLLPRFARGDEDFLLTDDVMDAASALQYIAYHTNAPDRLFPNVPANAILGRNLQIDLGADHSQIPPAFYSAARNLWRASSLPNSEDKVGNLVTRVYLGLTRVSSSSDYLLNLAEAQTSRQEILDQSHSSQFANSAYYMGSKKTLSGFLVEAMSTVLTPHESILDLMCGSGAAAGAFSHFWPTYASDAQQFCRNLAVVQGGGFSASRAQHLLHLISDHAHRNIEQLQQHVGALLETEEVIFHSDFAISTVEQYQQYYRTLPLYPDGGRCGSWDPTREVVERQRNPKRTPYCLATAYFANVYVGLRQAVEIDSLRYAIDQIADEIDRAWALGALITTISAVALTYAGHFAQPILGNAEAITEKKLPRIVERRAVSVMHEFAIRLLSLAEESETASYPVRIVPGPWKNAIESTSRHISEGIMVYLDAPYTRDEYSRYYHVLETISQYRYPCSIGPARIPSKVLGERFRSEFFTRNAELMRKTYADIILSVLEHNWKCAWSYSDGGAVAPASVIDDVARRRRVHVRSFSAPYVYKAQGGKPQKNVTEYLVVFEGK